MKGNYILIVLLALFASCGPSANHKNEETATSGHIYISADESLRPLIEAEESVFESIYPNAHLDFIYTSESDAVKYLKSDSVSVAILTRRLSDAEKQHFDDKKIIPRYSPFANDAIALILNKDNHDSVFTLSQLSEILQGNISTWNQINPASPDKAIGIVFDNGSSGAIRYLKDSVLGGKELSKNCYAVSSNPAVIDYVEKNKNSIGIIGMSWISDKDDSVSHGFLNRIRVADIVPKDPEDAEAPTLKPYQAYVALKQYPLWRTIEIVNCSGGTRLGTGFASFVASDRGQRIVLKAGIVPSTAPIRLIKMNND